MPRFEVSQNLRIVFFGVLLLAFAQVFWWIWDQSRYSNEELTRMTALYESDARFSEKQLAAGVDPGLVTATFPHVEVVGGTARPRPAALEELEARRFSRINQYRWEGGFFLVVLLGMMWLLSRTIQAEATLRRRQEDFVAAVSHELKSPLASLQLTAETMGRRPGDAESRTRHVRRILTDVQRLSTMVSNILDSSRLARGDIELNPESISLKSGVDIEISNLADRASVRGVLIETDVAEDIKVLADPSTVRVVVRNLLENALHATAAAGGGTIRLRAEVTSSSVALVVSDDGIGFPPSQSAKIFEAFFRVGTEINRSTPGSGLGLAIVRRYLELDGGRIDASSEGDGCGATFTVQWRRAPETLAEGVS